MPYEYQRIIPPSPEYDSTLTSLLNENIATDTRNLQRLENMEHRVIRNEMELYTLSSNVALTGEWRATTDTIIDNAVGSLRSIQEEKISDLEQELKECKELLKENEALIHNLIRNLNDEKKGEWVEHDIVGGGHFVSYECSKCKIMSSEETKYCSSCGSIMNLTIERGE